MLKYHDFIKEGSDPFLALYQEALTFITDEWTNWKYTISKLTTSIYSAKFEGEASFQDIQKLVVHLNSVKSHLGDDIDQFKFTINYDDSFELLIKANFIKEKVNKDIRIDDILSLGEEDTLDNYQILNVNLESLEDFLTKESGYKFEYKNISYNSRNGIEDTIIFLVTLPKDLKEETIEVQDSILVKKMDDIF